MFVTCRRLDLHQQIAEHKYNMARGQEGTFTLKPDPSKDVDNPCEKGSLKEIRKRRIKRT
jgi:hypothetical protein